MPSIKQNVLRASRIAIETERSASEHFRLYREVWPREFIARVVAREGREFGADDELQIRICRQLWREVERGSLCVAP